MVAGPAAGDAVERARRLPALRVGLHLAVIDAEPMLPPERIPHLVDHQGRLRNDVARLGLELVLSPAARREMRAEVEAQFAAFAATGLVLDHVNAHRHYHLHPIVGGLVLEIGARHGMRALRVPREDAATLRRIEPDSRLRGGLAVRVCAALLAARARRRGVAITDHMFGLSWSGAMSAARLAALLANPPPGLVEIYLHAATSDDFVDAAPGYAYRSELDALLDPACAQALRANGVPAGGFLDLLSA
jgi:hopanoid biosynthesis associated protein HpnK